MIFAVFIFITLSASWAHPMGQAVARVRVLVRGRARLAHDLRPERNFLRDECREILRRGGSLDLQAFASEALADLRARQRFQRRVVKLPDDGRGGARGRPETPPAADVVP